MKTSGHGSGPQPHPTCLVCLNSLDCWASEKLLTCRTASLEYSVPPNLTFYLDDLEDEWTFSTKFDFIYARMLTGSLRDWPKFMGQSFE